MQLTRLTIALHTRAQSVTLSWDKRELKVTEKKDNFNLRTIRHNAERMQKPVCVTALSHQDGAAVMQSHESQSEPLTVSVIAVKARS